MKKAINAILVIAFLFWIPVMLTLSVMAAVQKDSTMAIVATGMFLIATGFLSGFLVGFSIETDD